MPGTQPSILCGDCSVTAVIPKNATPDDELFCPTCKRVDTVGHAAAEARIHATHVAERAFENRMLARGRALSRRVPSKAPARSLRWISDYAGP